MNPKKGKLNESKERKIKLSVNISMNNPNQKVYVVSRLSSNMNRYVVSVHETEEGVAKVVLEEACDGDWYDIQEKMGWLNDDEDHITKFYMV